MAAGPRGTKNYHRGGRTSNKIDLSNMSLQSLPADILLLTNLTELSLAGNELESVGSGIGNFPGLKKLFLNDNKLSTVPPSN